MQPFVPEALPISAIKWERLIPLLARANQAIAHYRGTLIAVPNPDVLLSPFITQEAVLSSKIEGTQATLGEVLLFEAGDKPAVEERGRDIQEILNYRRALRIAQDELVSRPFGLNLLLRLHDTLLDSVRGRDKNRGRFRASQNWIGAPGTPMAQATFMPPSPTQLQPHLDAWEKYYHSEEKDALVQLAVIHAQFEIIHPFLDGNGRIGRILIPLFLYEKRILSRPVFYLSEYLEEHRDEYCHDLAELSRNSDSWNEWVRFFLFAIESQARRNSEKACAMIDLYKRLKEQLPTLISSSFAIPLLDLIFQRPVFRTSDLDFRGSNPSKASVSQLLKTLVEAQILKVVRAGAGRRPAIYAFPELLNLCEGRKVT
jgi:Fic family protein